MAFEGGRLSTLGITPSFVNNLAQQTAATGATQALGQVWKGSGQSFFGSAGQALAGNLAASTVNVTLNSALSTQVSGPGGFPINTGRDFLASSVTSVVTGPVAAGINENIQRSLQSAGPFGSVLSGVATNLVNQGVGALTGGILGLADSNVQARNYRMFPGGGKEGEAPADYSGGNAYTLNEVVFSLQPAFQGPQLDFSLAFDKTIDTKIPFGDVINSDFNVDYSALNGFKQSVMKGNFQGDVISTDTGLA